MQIKHCLRCDEDWCYRGTGAPLRCGKCKSPYWNEPKKGARLEVAMYVKTPAGPGAHDDGTLSAAMAGKVGKREGIQDRGSKERGVAVRGSVHKVAQAKRQGESAIRVGVERVDEESQSGLVPESVRDEEAVDEEPVSEVWPADGVGKVGVVEVSGKEGLRVSEAIDDFEPNLEDLEPSGGDRLGPWTTNGTAMLEGILRASEPPEGPEGPEGPEEPEVLMCSFTEYDTDTGETYRCGREVHGPKVKHTRGEKV